GDAGGRLWRLDFDEGWPQRLPPTSPLFAAADGHGQAQAIPLRPALAFAAHGYLVLFGASGAAGDSFYAIHDHQRSSEVLTRAQLAPRLLREVVAGQGARH